QQDDDRPRCVSHRGIMPQPQGALQNPCMLHIPVVGGLGQSVVAVAVVQCIEQYERLPPMKQTLLVHSSLTVQTAPKGSSMSLSMLARSAVAGAGSLPPQAESSAVVARSRPSSRPSGTILHMARSCTIRPRL